MMIFILCVFFGCLFYLYFGIYKQNCYVPTTKTPYLRENNNSEEEDAVETVNTAVKEEPAVEVTKSTDEIYNKYRTVKLKRAQLAFKYSVSELAEYLGVHRSTVYKWYKTSIPSNIEENDKVWGNCEYLFIVYDLYEDNKSPEIPEKEVYGLKTLIYRRETKKISVMFSKLKLLMG